MGACWDRSQWGGREYGLLWEIIKTPVPPSSSPLLAHTQNPYSSTSCSSEVTSWSRSSCAALASCFVSVQSFLIPVRKLSSLQPRVHLWCALRKKCDSLHKKQMKSASFCSAEWPCMVFVFRFYVASLKCRTTVKTDTYSVLFCLSTSVNSFVYEWTFLN